MKNGWQTKKIGDVCRLMTGGTPSKAKHEYFGGEIKWLVSGDIHQREILDCDGRINKAGMKNSNAKLLPVNSVMIALNGQGKTRGTVALLRTPATCNQSLVSIYPIEPEKLLPEFLYANLHGRYQEIRHMTGDTGNDRRGLNMILIKSIEIPIPPLPEQKRIVGILDEAFDGIATAKANAEKNLQNARALFESHLESVFTQRGPGWKEKTLEEVADSNCTLSYGIVQPGEERPNGLPIVRPTDLTTKVIQLSGLKRIDAKLAAAYKRTALLGGELLLCVRGSTGVVSIASTELIGANVTRGIVPIRFNRALVTPDFGFYLISSAQVQGQIREKTYGAALMQINIRDLRIITLSFPPLREQEGIAAKLDELHEETQRLESIYQKKLAALDALKKSLLHQAFSGQL
jgi:restriction endonuclease S subunit